MSRVRKYLPGDVVSTTRAVEIIVSGRFLMLRGKPVPPAWARQWTVGLINILVACSDLREALINPDWQARVTTRIAPEPRT